MIQTPMDVLKNHPIRRTDKQKKAFREAVQSYAQGLGYYVRPEAGKGRAVNLVIGDPESARYLICAHYDTPAALWVPQIMMPCSPVWNGIWQTLTAVLSILPALGLGTAVTLVTRDAYLGHLTMLGGIVLSLLLMVLAPASRRNANCNTSGVVALLETALSMPRSLRSRVCFVLFDRGEAGQAGSAGYRRNHKAATDRQTVVDLNCVGDGDTILLVPGKGMGEDVNLLRLERRCGPKQVNVWKKRHFCGGGDHAVFPKGVAVTALRRGRLAHWTARSRKNLDYTNINILRACLTTWIGSTAVE